MKLMHLKVTASKECIIGHHCYCLDKAFQF